MDAQETHNCEENLIDIACHLRGSLIEPVYNEFFSFTIPFF